MRRLFLVLLLTLMPQMLLAYEPGLINLKSPADLDSGQVEFKIQHRFYGDVTEDTLDSLFGADSGGNIGINLRYSPFTGLELNAARLRTNREYVLGIGYGCAIPAIPLRCQVDVQYFRYEEFSFEISGIDKENGVFGMLSLQTEPLLDRITATVNLGYDSDEEEFGAGFGLALTILELTGTVQKISAIGEYFPTTNADEAYNTFAFGIRIETYGHHFDLILGNTSELGEKRVMAGTSSTVDMSFGFNVRRRFF